MDEGIIYDDYMTDSIDESDLLACSNIKGGPVNPLEKLEVVYEIVFDKG